MDLRIKNSMRSVILLFLLLSVLGFVLIMLWKFQANKEYAIAHVHERSHSVDSKLLEEVWESLKNEMRLLRQETGSMFGKVEDKLPDVPVFQTNTTDDAKENSTEKAQIRNSNGEKNIITPKFH